MRQWKVLRETDGERFVAIEKGCCFQGDFADRENENRWNTIFLRIENFLYVIMISSRKRVVCVSKRPTRRVSGNKFRQCR